MDLYLIRHGEPDLSGSDLGDPPLTELGRLQSASTAARLWTVAFDRLYVSPQLRARETAEPFLLGRNLEPVVDERIAEFDYGTGSYLPAWFGEDVDRREAMRRLAELQGPDFHQRVRAGMADIIDHNPGGTVAVVCHGGVISSFLKEVLGAREPLSPHHASVTRVAASRKGVRSVLAFNEHHWVPASESDPSRGLVSGDEAPDT